MLGHFDFPNRWEIAPGVGTVDVLPPNSSPAQCTQPPAAATGGNHFTAVPSSRESSSMKGATWPRRAWRFCPPAEEASSQQGLDWVSKGQRPELQMERFMPLSSPQDQANLDPSSAYMFAQPLPCSVPIPSLPYRFTREQYPSKPLSQALFLGNLTKGRASGAVRGGRLHREQGWLPVALPGPRCGLVGRLWELHWADKQTGRPRGSPA